MALIPFPNKAILAKRFDIPIREALCVEFGSHPPVPGQIRKAFRGSAGGFLCVGLPVLLCHIVMNNAVIL